MLGVVPALGREIDATDDQPGAGPVVVLTDQLWRRRYNADPDIVGQAIPHQRPAPYRRRRAAGRREVPVPADGVRRAGAARARRAPRRARSAAVRPAQGRRDDRAGARGPGRGDGPARRVPRREQGLGRARAAAARLFRAGRSEGGDRRGTRRRDAGPAHRLRERREPAAGPRHVARARDVHAVGPRRRTRAPRAAAAHRGARARPRVGPARHRSHRRRPHARHGRRARRRRALPDQVPASTRRR